MFRVPADTEASKSFHVRLHDFGTHGRLVYAAMLARPVSDAPTVAFTGDVRVVEGLANLAFEPASVFFYQDAFEFDATDPWAEVTRHGSLAAQGGAHYGVADAGDLVLAVDYRIAEGDVSDVDIDLHVVLRTEVF